MAMLVYQRVVSRFVSTNSQGRPFGSIDCKTFKLGKPTGGPTTLVGDEGNPGGFFFTTKKGRQTGDGNPENGEE